MAIKKYVGFRIARFNEAGLHSSMTCPATARKKCVKG